MTEPCSPSTGIILLFLRTHSGTRNVEAFLIMIVIAYHQNSVGFRRYEIIVFKSASTLLVLVREYHPRGA